MLRSCRRIVKFVMAGKKLSLIIVFVLFMLICHLARVGTHNTDCGLIESNNNNVIPWIANIYQLTSDGGHEFICLGTVVSAKIVLTAAHCFYDDNTKKIKNANFIVNVGQNSKAWSDNNKYTISQNNIIINKDYKGISEKYANNIAIARLDGDQEFNTIGSFKKACVYWDNDFVESQFEANTPALKVAVWGETKDSTFTFIDPIYVDCDECLYSVSKDFQPFLTFDKMCVQVPSIPSLSSIGSGLYAFDTDKNRWFLIGIASEVTSAKSKTYMTFIKIQPHLNWISNTAFLEVR